MKFSVYINSIIIFFLFLFYKAKGKDLQSETKCVYLEVSLGDFEARFSLSFQTSVSKTSVKHTFTSNFKKKENICKHALTMIPAQINHGAYYKLLSFVL